MLSKKIELTLQLTKIAIMLIGLALAVIYLIWKIKV